MTTVRPIADGDGKTLRKVARGGVINLVGAATSAAANLVLIAVIARSVSKVDAGVFFTATSLFLVVETLVGFGTGTGLVYFVTKLRTRGEEHRIPSLLRSVLVPVLAASVIAAVIGVTLAATGSIQLLGGSAHGPTYITVLAAFLPVAALSDAIMNTTQGYGSMAATSLGSSIARPTLQLALAVIALAAHETSLLAAAWVLPYAASLAVGYRWLHRRAPIMRRTRGEGPPSPMRREFWMFSGPRALSSLAQITLQRLDIVLVAAMRGPADAAIYTAATRFLVVGQAGALAVSQAVQPHLAMQLHRADSASLRATYQTATAWLVMITWPAYFAFTLFASLLLGVFGTSYRSGSNVVVILCLTMLLATACGMVDMLLLMSGRTSWNLANVTTALAVNIGLNVVLIPRFGILGAAVAWSAAILCNNLLPLAQIIRALHVHPFGRSTSYAFASTVAGALVPLALCRWLIGNSLVALGCGLGASIVLIMACLWRGREILDLDAFGSLIPSRESNPGRVAVPSRST